MDAGQNGEGARRHAEEAESKWVVVLEKEANVQAGDEQESVIYAAERRPLYEESSPGSSPTLAE
jgi:hypothetical protein